MTRNEKLIPVYWERMISLMPKKTVKKIHMIGHSIDASVDFSKEGMVHLDFTFLEVAARILAESSGEKESDIMNHVLSPLFPDIVFTEDELGLIIVMSCEYGVTTLPYDLVDFINSNNAVQFDLDGALDSLIKKGFLSFDGKDITIHEDLPCGFEVEEKRITLREFQWRKEMESEREMEEQNAMRSYFRELLEMYMKDLEKKVEHTKVIAHAADVDIFLNRYLPEEGVGDLNEAACMVDDYFTDFFVPRCKWASPRTVKSTALHLKEFFKCMANHKKIDEDLYSDVCSVITDNLEIWQSESKWVIYPPFDRRS